MSHSASFARVPRSPLKGNILRYLLQPGTPTSMHVHFRAVISKEIYWPERLQRLLLFVRNVQKSQVPARAEKRQRIPIKLNIPKPGEAVIRFSKATPVRHVYVVPDVCYLVA